jgi:YD repeat-containing protein
VEGQLHGLCRTWHYNGQMAGELRYRHGQLHGVCRQWDERGRLLGSFTMNHGTGTQRYWHQNGQLRAETDFLNGKFHGRMRNWLRDGTLVQETFLIENGDVTRATYLQAARKHPNWPQYEGQPAGRVARENRALERREHETFVNSLQIQSHAEAGKWLSEAKRPDLRSLAKFRTAGAALRFVEALYAAGAVTVLVLPIYSGKRGKLFADWLLVKLPKPPSKRKALRKLCQEFCDKRDGALLPEKELGESHLFIRLA